MKLTTDRQLEASRGLSATAKLLVLLRVEVKQFVHIAALPSTEEVDARRETVSTVATLC